MLEPTRGTGRAKLAGGVYQHWYGVGVSRCNPTNPADKRGSLLRVSDPNGVGLACGTCSANINIVPAGGKANAGIIAYCNVE